MEILMIVVAVAFAVLLVVGALHFLQDTPPAAGKKAAGRAALAAPPAGGVLAAASKRDGKADFIALLQKRIAVEEEKIKNLEGEFQAQRLELARAREHIKKLEEEKASMSHEAQVCQKIQKDYAVLKDEASKKDKILEEEISLRRKQTTQLTNAMNDLDAQKKQLSQAQDAFRKTQALYERTTTELRETRAALDKHVKTAQEQAGQKTQGGWVAREEFEKVERELTEKEAFIKKLLALQQQPPPGPGATP
ncbi:MAG: hypothetical protein ACM3L6_05620 [Deltaproteobacteria bacterium]